jgi:hypothetical protein
MRDKRAVSFCNLYTCSLSYLTAILDVFQAGIHDAMKDTARVAIAEANGGVLAR